MSSKIALACLFFKSKDRKNGVVKGWVGRRTGGLDAGSGGLTNFLVDGSGSVLDALGDSLVGDWGAGEGAHLAEESLADERHDDVVVEVI